MNDLVITTQSGTGIANIGSGNSVLGQLQPKIPVGGRIRPGIMVLTKAAADNQQAVTLYKAGVRDGVPFNKLAYQIKEKCNFTRSPLTPRNVPYFSVRPGDFKTPTNADLIMQLYGEERDDAEGRQLYRFPVIFPLDNWQGNMPHEFACYSASERVYWSQYDDNGGRSCMMHAAPEFIGQGNKRQARRTAGGRLAVTRPDNDGVCVPEDCPEYQSRACMLTGRFIFYVPGLPGSSAIELPTRSFYALQNARQQMEMMAYITGGRISGTHKGNALFFISKKNEAVSMIDPKTGKAKRQNQWIITLEAAVEMTQIFEHQEAAQALADGSQAAAALGHQPKDDADDIPGEFDTVLTTDDVGHVRTDDETYLKRVTPEERVDHSTGEVIEGAVSNEGPDEGDILRMIEKAESIDEVNEALDLSRDIDASDETRASIQKACSQRIKEIMG